MWCFLSSADRRWSCCNRNPMHPDKDRLSVKLWIDFFPELFILVYSNICIEQCPPSVCTPLSRVGRPTKPPKAYARMPICILGSNSSNAAWLWFTVFEQAKEPQSMSTCICAVYFYHAETLELRSNKRKAPLPMIPFAIIRTRLRFCRATFLETKNLTWDQAGNQGYIDRCSFHKYWRICDLRSLHFARHIHRFPNTVFCCCFVWSQHHSCIRN